MLPRLFTSPRRVPARRTRVGLLAAGVVALCGAASVPAVAAPAPSTTPTTTSTAPDPARAGLFGRQDPGADGAFRQSFALLGLAAAAGRSGRSAADQPAPDEATRQGADWLVRQQCPDGGWQAFRADLSKPCTRTDPKNFAGEDTNSTAVALSALTALGVRPGRDALAFLTAAQNRDGGWSYLATPGASDPSSTALVVQALLAAGEDPASARWTKPGGRTPYDLLERRQAGCTKGPGTRGGVAVSADAAPDVLSTTQAVPALAAATFPLPRHRPGEAPPSQCSGARFAPADASADAQRDAAADAGAAWLARKLTPAGALAGTDGSPSFGQTTYGVLALAASDAQGPAAERALGWLRDNLAKGPVTQGGDSAAALGQAVMAVVAMDADPTTFGGQDLVARLRRIQQPPAAGASSSAAAPSASAATATAAASTAATAAATAGGSGTSGGGGSSAGVGTIAALAGAVVVAGAVAGLLLRRRRGAG